MSSKEVNSDSESVLSTGFVIYMETVVTCDSDRSAESDKVNRMKRYGGVPTPFLCVASTDYSGSVSDESGFEGEPQSNGVIPTGQPEIVNISFPKADNGGIGLSIVAAEPPGTKNLGIYVKKVISGSASDKDGRLAAGDQLLAVNGNSLQGISQEKAAELMARSGQYVSFDVAKRAAVYNGVAVYLAENSPQVLPKQSHRPPSQQMQSMTSLTQTPTSSMPHQQQQPQPQNRLQAGSSGTLTGATNGYGGGMPPQQQQMNGYHNPQQQQNRSMSTSNLIHGQPVSQNQYSDGTMRHQPYYNTQTPPHNQQQQNPYRPGPSAARSTGTLPREYNSTPQNAPSTAYYHPHTTTPQYQNQHHSSVMVSQQQPYSPDQSSRYNGGTLTSGGGPPRGHQPLPYAVRAIPPQGVPQQQQLVHPPVSVSQVGYSNSIPLSQQHDYTPIWAGSSGSQASIPQGAMISTQDRLHGTMVPPAIGSQEQQQQQQTPQPNSYTPIWIGATGSTQQQTPRSISPTPIRVSQPPPHTPMNQTPTVQFVPRVSAISQQRATGQPSQPPRAQQMPPSGSVNSPLSRQHQPLDQHPPTFRAPQLVGQNVVMSSPNATYSNPPLTGSSGALYDTTDSSYPNSAYSQQQSNVFQFPSPEPSALQYDGHERDNVSYYQQQQANPPQYTSQQPTHYRSASSISSPRIPQPPPPEDMEPPMSKPWQSPVIAHSHFHYNGVSGADNQHRRQPPPTQRPISAYYNGYSAPAPPAYKSSPALQHRMSSGYPGQQPYASGNSQSNGYAQQGEDALPPTHSVYNGYSRIHEVPLPQPAQQVDRLQYRNNPWEREEVERARVDDEAAVEQKIDNEIRELEHRLETLTDSELARLRKLRLDKAFNNQLRERELEMNDDSYEGHHNDNTERMAQMVLREQPGQNEDINFSAGLKQNRENLERLEQIKLEHQSEQEELRRRQDEHQRQDRQRRQQEYFAQAEQRVRAEAERERKKKENSRRTEQRLAEEAAAIQNQRMQYINQEQPPAPSQVHGGDFSYEPRRVVQFDDAAPVVIARTSSDSTDPNHLTYSGGGQEIDQTVQTPTSPDVDFGLVPPAPKSDLAYGNRSTAVPSTNGGGMGHSYHQQPQELPYHEATPPPSSVRLVTSEETPAVIGRNERYNDPRERRLQRLKQDTGETTEEGDKLSFTDKLKKFNSQTPKDRFKASTAQREIEQSSYYNQG